MTDERLEEINKLTDEFMKNSPPDYKTRNVLVELLAEVRRLQALNRSESGDEVVRLKSALDARLARTVEEGGADLVRGVWAEQSWRFFEWDAKGIDKNECVSYGHRSDTWIEHDPDLAAYIQKTEALSATSAADFLNNNGSTATPLPSGDWMVSPVPGARGIVMVPYELEREAKKRGWPPELPETK